MDCGSKPTWCAVWAVVVILLIVLAVGFLVFAIVQRNKKLKLKNEQRPLISDPKKNSDTGIAMNGAALTFTPMTGAFMIPFEQLEVGKVIAVGAQGQVRKGNFSGKAVAIKELLAVMFDSDGRKALKV